MRSYLANIQQNTNWAATQEQSRKSAQAGKNCSLGLPREALGTSAEICSEQKQLGFTTHAVKIWNSYGD